MEIRKRYPGLGVLLVALALTAGCGGDDEAGDCWAPSAHEPVAVGDLEGVERTSLTLVAYDSFFVSDGVLETFESETGISVKVLTAADTGTMVSQAVLNVGDPVADVMWGIDNTFLCRALVHDIFVPYEASGLSEVPAELRLDPQNRVTPVDYSDLCINYRVAALAELGLDPPAGLEDLRDARYASTLVTENPETSPSGMGLLLASIAQYGDPGWEEFWKDLAEGGVAVEAGWSEAYYGRFDADSGDRAMVMSYATSPVAELIYSDPPVDVPPTEAMLEGCFRSVEFAGILAGTDNPVAAALLVDFLLSPTMQEDLPLSMFVFPANSAAEVPGEFRAWATSAIQPAYLAPDLIEANRDDWTERWTDIVLR